MKYQISDWLNHRFYPFVWKQLKPISSWTVSRWTVVPCGCRWSAATRPSHRRRFRRWRHADWAKLSRKNRATIYPSPTVFRRAIRRQLTACRAHDPPRPTFYFIRIRCLGLAATDCPPRPRWRRPGADLRCTPCPKRTTSLPTRRCRLHDADRPLAPLMWWPSTWPKSRKWSVLSSKKTKTKWSFQNLWINLHWNETFTCRQVQQKLALSCSSSSPSPNMQRRSQSFRLSPSASPSGTPSACHSPVKRTASHKGVHNATPLELGPGQILPAGFKGQESRQEANVGQIKMGVILSKGHLEVEIISARNLPLIDGSLQPDTYTEVTWLDSPAQLN